MDKTRMNFLLNQGWEFFLVQAKGGGSCWGVFFKGGEPKVVVFFGWCFPTFYLSCLNARIFVTKHVMTLGFTRIKGSNYYTRWALLLVTNALVAPINGLKNMGNWGVNFSPLWVESRTRLHYRPLSGDLYGWHQGSSREGSPGDPHTGRKELLMFSWGIGREQTPQTTKKHHQPKNYPPGN